MSTPSVIDGNVVAQADLADQLAHRRVGAGAALVAGDLEAAGVAGRVGEQRVDVGSRVLARPSRSSQFESTPAHGALRGHLEQMKHTPHGYWLEEAGEVEPLPALSGEREADVVVVGGGYTGHVGGLAR